MVRLGDTVCSLGYHNCLVGTSSCQGSLDGFWLNLPSLAQIGRMQQSTTANTKRGSLMNYLFAHIPPWSINTAFLVQRKIEQWASIALIAEEQAIGDNSVQAVETPWWAVPKEVSLHLLVCTWSLLLMVVQMIKTIVVLGICCWVINLTKKSTKTGI